jgi:hypothetical protein
MEVLPKLYRLPRDHDTPPDARLISFPGADAANGIFPQNNLRVLPQLLEVSEDPNTVLQVLSDFRQEMEGAAQTKAFVMCDEKLFEICQKLKKRSQVETAPFIFLLDPFHFGWNMEKVTLLFLF